ncbi:hypothetical protein BCR37DRAFT_378876 [Protomyces lactucae-debilis]|uniref:NADH dehydrogenase [ubiquinone] 1 beta subcomplex subunit 9 n=1 Tax=Protomyces lactucae-debilis TaxID=2754530 RepID=A0A1Y2FIR8_PROLT|nr:uncharacterized protein BCR37DRAFT_378876 [Protomyces lactucae-debilis]ORY83862.1 hypothetical protein BCR37DRAFT_378876 [Protomyces lactucae-debilis]
MSSIHRSRVASLYKRSLTLTRDWTVHRELWFEEAAAIRKRFEANRQVTNPRLVEDLLRKGEEMLVARKHPDPYIVPTFPGGSKWERNLHPRIGEPKEIH